MKKNNKNKKNNIDIIYLILIIVILICGIIIEKNNYFGSRKNIKITKTEDVASLTLFQVSINNITVSFPSNMYTIEATGWDINKKMENDHLDPGLSISGGRIGKYPGGAVISFINRSNSEKKLKDCDIDDIVFYNPNNKKENVYFVGGINYNSTENEIKKVMENLNYNGIEDRHNEDEVSYTYYLNGDKENYGDYIKFELKKRKIKSVSIYTNEQ